MLLIRSDLETALYANVPPDGTDVDPPLSVEIDVHGGMAVRCELGGSRFTVSIVNARTTPVRGSLRGKLPLAGVDRHYAIEVSASDKQPLEVVRDYAIDLAVRIGRRFVGDLDRSEPHPPETDPGGFQS